MADTSKASGSSAPTTTTAPAAHPQQVTNKDLPTLGPLDDDDEFEEFAVHDWDESETISAAISSSTTKANNNAAPSLTMAGSGSSTATTSASGPGCTNATGGPADHLWEDNWDDDDTEDEWSKRLREHLAS